MFDLDALAAVLAEHDRVVRVVIADHDGSSPRENGAHMLVWADGQSGTIGGGALEWEASKIARTMLADAAPGPRLERAALGPRLGQCCGGAVTVLSELYRAVDLEAIRARCDNGYYARPVTTETPAGTDPDKAPMPVRALIARARAEGLAPAAQLIRGWMVEPLRGPHRPLWIWGAGHVGRALIGVLAPLPEFEITWLDTAQSRFPPEIPAKIRPLWAEDLAGLVRYAPTMAEHLVLTYSHALDLELCHRLLGHGCASLGLIGSKTKWARFRARLSTLGHPPGRIAAIRCPIGEKALGKHPQAIALGVAAQLLRDRGANYQQGKARRDGQA